MHVVDKVNELPRRWYHGTINTHAKSISDGIKLEFCNSQVDFGKGFYLTTNKEQALKWATKKAKIHNDTEIGSQNFVIPALVVCDIDVDLLNSLSGLIFKEENNHWARFVLANRTINCTKYIPHNRDMTYDYVYGPLADGNRLSLLVARAEKTGEIDEFLQKILWSKGRFPQQNQLSIHTERAIDLITVREVSYHGTLQKNS